MNRQMKKASETEAFYYLESNRTNLPVRLLNENGSQSQGQLQYCRFELSFPVS
jgi:hypothetical protein